MLNPPFGRDHDDDTPDNRIGCQPRGLGVKLVRSFTLVPASAVIIANVIGTGIFVKTRVMTCNVGTPEMVLAVWVAAGDVGWLDDRPQSGSTD